MSPVAARFAFGPFVLSGAQRRLLKKGRDLPLIPRYFDLLLLLVEQRGRLVERGEIMEQVWGDVVVSDGALSQAVRTLRRTLGDDSRQPRYIRTVARKGYQFIHPDVQEVDDGVPLAGAARRVGLRWGDAAAGGALVGGLAGLLQGLMFLLITGGTWPLLRLPVDMVLGVVIGGAGAAGVGAGMAMAEAFSSYRRPALVLGGALAGGLTGLVTLMLGRMTIEEVFGRDLTGVGGLPEGLVLGGAAALGYALAGGQETAVTAAPRGAARRRLILITGLVTACGAGLLVLAGGRMAGASLDLIAGRIPEATLPLQPLADLVGEPVPGRVTYLIQGIYEGLLFGSGLGYGLSRRPR